MNVILKLEVRNFETLVEFDAWQGGARVLEDAIKMGKIEELDELCEMVFEGQSVDETTINDWLWFDEEVNAMVYGE